MKPSYKWPAVLGALAASCGVYAAAPEPPPEPRITSIFPFAGEVGKPFEAEVRGRNLKGARSLWFDGGSVQARILRVEDATAPDEILHVSLTVHAAPKSFRVVTPAGVSNALNVRVSPVPVFADRTLSRVPAVLFGRIAQPGDVNTYPITVQGGQTLSFDVQSGFRGLDPIITIAQRSGSWFDPDRINPIAANDDPLFFPGLSTDAHLVHRFTKAGEYLVRISSFSGQGGPDHGYQLTVAPGESPAPDLHPRWTDLWDERQFTRRMSNDWISQLAARGADTPAARPPESYRAAKESSGTLPVFTPPGMVEGRIEHPGETHLIQLKIDQAQGLAIEIETPEATMPRFNPIVRLTEPGGNEVVTNVYTKLNNNGLYMMKMIQAKTVFSLSAPGIYTLEIRDITTDRGGADFRYRVLVRPQIPHAGKVVTAVDHINLSAGETRTLTVTLDREEDFGGVVALLVDNLPPGVTAIPAMDKPEERPPLPNGGKLERYTPKPQTASLLLVASANAAPSDQPVKIRLSARPIVKGQWKDAIPVAEIPMMLIARRPL